VPEPIVLDTSGLLAAIDAAQHNHREVREVLEHTDAALLLSPFVLAELDYLLATKVGAREQLALLGEVERGAYRLETFSAADVWRARHVIERYADLALSLADASNLVLCYRHATHNLLTLDERHFRATLGPDDKPVRLLPADRQP
jgi:predicted nucleic acid-binding protein